MIAVKGNQLIGNTESGSDSASFEAFNPKDGQPLPVSFFEATSQQIDAAIQLAEKAFPAYKGKTNEQRAEFLEQIAEEILLLGDTLIKRAMLETALPEGRLTGERGRTMNQLKLFASVVREGSWVDARIDRAIPDRAPVPRQDIRQMLQPLGPVGIFGASNFPLAFSVAGGDTASALATGCTVVVKGHPAHPGTSELVGKAILEAARKTKMPEGVFSLVQGRTNEVGAHIVKHPLIQAVGFTGSFKGGKALFDMANQRPVSIPVFAEMGSVNPVFVLPEALSQRGVAIGQGLAASLTLGVGQFCTCPGLIFLPDSAGKEDLQAGLATAIREGIAGTMLTSGIRKAFTAGIKVFKNNLNFEMLAVGKTDETANSVSAHVFGVPYQQFKENPSFSEEVFGPSGLLVYTDSKEQLMAAAGNLEGHLTATIHGTPTDLQNHSNLLDILERKVGRLIINGYPTGVEVCHAMVHGGPFPATTAPQTTSVGTNAIKRFARPVCYQSFPNSHLPPALKEENPLKIWRLTNGEWAK